MQIALIGASGATGRHVCRLARAAGHTVRAYSRTGRPIEGQNVDNHPLDATDPDAVTAAVAGADAIVSVIGGELDTRSDGIAALVTAAKRHGITRLIGLGGAGALLAPAGGVARDQPWFPAMMRPVTDAHLRALAHLEASGLRWTFICPPRMVDGEETGRYRHGPDTLIIGSMTTRYADVAHLIVRCLEDDLYVGHRVAIVD